MPLPASFPELASLDLFVSVIELGSVSRAAEAHGMPSRRPAAASNTSNGNWEGSCSTAFGWLHADRRRRRRRCGPTRSRAPLTNPRSDSRRFEPNRPAGFVFPPASRSRSTCSPMARPLLPRPPTRFGRPRGQLTTVIDRLRHGAADLGFIETPSELSGLNEQIVGHDEFVVVAPSHPWATRGSVPLTLAATLLVMREAGSGTREALERPCVIWVSASQAPCWSWAPPQRLGRSRTATPQPSSADYGRRRAQHRPADRDPGSRSSHRPRSPPWPSGSGLPTSLKLPSTICVTVCRRRRRRPCSSTGGPDERIDHPRP